MAVTGSDVSYLGDLLGHGRWRTWSPMRSHPHRRGRQQIPGPPAHPLRRRNRHRRRGLVLRPWHQYVLSVSIWLAILCFEFKRDVVLIDCELCAGLAGVTNSVHSYDVLTRKWIRYFLVFENLHFFFWSLDWVKLDFEWQFWRFGCLNFAELGPPVTRRRLGLRMLRLQLELWLFSRWFEPKFVWKDLNFRAFRYLVFDFRRFCCWDFDSMFNSNWLVLYG